MLHYIGGALVLLLVADIMRRLCRTRARRREEPVDVCYDSKTNRIISGEIVWACGCIMGVHRRELCSAHYAIAKAEQ